MKNHVLRFVTLLFVVCSWQFSVSANTISAGPGTVTVVGDGDVCKGEQATYSIYLPNPNYTYVWTVPSGGSLISSTATTATVLWTTTPTGTVEAEAIDAGVSQGTGTKGVTISEKPDPFITSDVAVGCASQIDTAEEDVIPERDESRCFVVCEGSEVVFTANGDAGSTFAWSATGGTVISASGNTAAVEFNSVGFGQISVTETNASGCTETAIRCIEVIGKPNAEFVIVPQQVFDQGTTCTYRELNFINYSNAGAGSPLVSWQWDFGDGTYSNDPNPSHTYTQEGSYTITLTVENECNCTDVFTFEIIVKEAEPIEIDCPSVVCENTEVFYTANDPNCGNFMWDIIGGTVTTGDPHNDPYIGVTWDHVGPDGIGYISVGGQCGDDCPTSIKIPVVKSEGEIEGETSLCEEEQYLYRLPRWPATLYDWTFTGDIQIFPTDQPNEIVVIPNTGGSMGTIRCTYQNDLIGCGGKASLDLYIVPKAEIAGPKLACIGVGSEFELNNGYSGNWTVRDESGAVITGTGNAFTPTFTSTGTHVLTVTGSSFCSPDPLEIEVLDKPVEVDHVNGPEEVCADVPYDYTAGNSVPGTTLNWAVEGGSFSNATPTISGEKATITFSGSGPYIIKVWREHQADVGCASDTLFKEIQEKQINLSVNGEANVCSNSYQMYEATYTEGDIYEWKIIPETRGSVVAGDGGPGIQVLWNDAAVVQTADLELSMRVCGRVETVTVPITIDPSASINVSTTPSGTVCRGQQVAVSVTGITSASSVDWDFGDGNTTTTTGLSVNHTYTALNSNNVSYTISATAHDPNGCMQSATASTSITVQPSPVAFISPAGNRTVCQNLPISESFTATLQSGPGTYTYDWYEAGAPSTSLGTGTSYTATAAGSYYCTVTNTATGCSDNTNTINVTVISCGGPGGGCAHSNSPLITLTDNVNSCGDVTVNASYSFSGFNHSWSGTPTSSNATSADYTFNKAGHYNVRYMVDRNINGNVCNYSNTISVIVPYIAKLKYDITCSGGQYNVELRDHSNFYPSTPIDDYDFWVDGNLVQSGTSTTHNTNLSPGPHTFKLVIRGSGYPDCEVTETVNLPALPVADFSFNFNGACQGFPIEFTNLSTPAGGLEYLWDFGDQSKVRVKDPSRVFTGAGQKSVTLTVTNSVGCQASVTKQVEVAQNNLFGDMSPVSAIVCEGTPLTLSFDKTPFSTTPAAYYWQPDSFAIVTNPSTNTQEVYESGTYFVTVTDANKCVKSFDDVEVEFVPVPHPVIMGPSTVCMGEDVDLFGSVGAGDYDYQWSIISGSGTIPNATDPNVSMSTSAGDLSPGNYTFQLTVSISSPINCSRTATFDVEVRDKPAPPTYTRSMQNCNPYTVQLTASHSSAGTFTWSDGQSGSSIEVNKGGEYYVTFTDEYGCTSRTRVDVPKSPDEYIWIYPLGCYQLCLEEVKNMEGFDIPDPIIDFDSWGIYENASAVYSGSGSIPNVLLPVNNGVGSYSYSYELGLNGCEAESKYIDLEITEECCRLEVEPRDMEYIERDESCSNVIDIYFGNPHGQPISVSLSSDLGVFVPNTVTVPPGGGNFTFEFFPYSGVTAGSMGTLSAVSEFQVDPEQKIRCTYEGEIILPSPELCDNDTWKRGDARGVDNESKNGVFTLAPNPAQESANVMYELPTWKEGNIGSIEVHDLRGALMATYSIDKGEGVQMLNTSNWQSSVYIIVFRVNGEVVDYQRLIIQR